MSENFDPWLTVEVQLSLLGLYSDIATAEAKYNDSQFFVDTGIAAYQLHSAFTGRPQIHWSVAFARGMNDPIALMDIMLNRTGNGEEVNYGTLTEDYISLGSGLISNR